MAEDPTSSNQPRNLLDVLQRAKLQIDEVFRVAASDMVANTSALGRLSGATPLASNNTCDTSCGGGGGGSGCLGRVRPEDLLTRIQELESKLLK